MNNFEGWSVTLVTHQPVLCYWSLFRSPENIRVSAIWEAASHTFLLVVSEEWKTDAFGGTG